MKSHSRIRTIGARLRVTVVGNNKGKHYGSEIQRMFLDFIGKIVWPGGA